MRQHEHFGGPREKASRPARQVIGLLAFALVISFGSTARVGAQPVAADAPAAAASGVGGQPVGIEAAAAMSAAAAASAAPAASVAAEPAASAGPPAVVEQPRSFGHVLGDVLTQRILLEHAGRKLELATLPPADRVGLWLERQAVRIETDDEGRRWLAIDYQIVNAPRALMSVSLPALTIATSSGVPLAVPAWPISIGPLTPEAVFGQGELQPLRPDRPVALLPTAGLQRQFVAVLLMLGIVLLAWLGWWAWRNAREAHRLPFARAWQELRQLARTHRGQPLDAIPDAWVALHRALNATAGRVVHQASLPRLLAEAPHLRPLAGRLEGFYRQSAARFFADSPPASPDELLQLCRDLRQAEQRHAR